MEGVNVLPSMYSWAMYSSPPRRLEPSPPLQANLTLESEELGAGNFGTVYKAKYNFLKCAVKVLHPNFPEPRSTGDHLARVRTALFASASKHCAFY